MSELPETCEECEQFLRACAICGEEHCPDCESHICEPDWLTGEVSQRVLAYA
jgi:hypothetical protein